MASDWIRRFCLSHPHTSESVQWGAHLVFKVAGKIFAIMALEPQRIVLSFKCTPEDFAELTERQQIVPAPYLAKAKWVGLESERALPPAELKEKLRASYQLVFEKLPKSVRAKLCETDAGGRQSPRQRHAGAAQRKSL